MTGSASGPRIRAGEATPSEIATFGNVHGLLFRIQFRRLHAAGVFDEPLIMAIGVSSGRSYRRSGAVHPVLGHEYLSEHGESTTSHSFAKMDWGLVFHAAGKPGAAGLLPRTGRLARGSSDSGTPDYDAVMPFDDSLPFVIACLIGAAITGFIWLRGQSRWSLAATVVLVLAGVGAFLVDQVAVTDREHLRNLFPRLAIAAEQQDVATVMESLDPELRPLREAAEQILKRIRPTEVLITKLDVSVDTAKTPLQATAAMIVRVTGEVIEKGNQGTVLAGVKVLLHKRDGVWLIKDAEVEKAKPGQDL